MANAAWPKAQSVTFDYSSGQPERAKRFRADERPPAAPFQLADLDEHCMLNWKAVSLVLALGWLTQAAAAPDPASKAPDATPSAESLALARSLVSKSGGGGLMAMNGVSLPMNTLLRQLGIHPDQSKLVMSQAIMPVLLDHNDDLTAIQVNSYAAVLSDDTMKAAIAFYDSPAGRALVRARAPMMQMNSAAISKLFETLKPEFVARTTMVLKPQNAGKP